MALIARVRSRKGTRKGRGFSEEEVKEAGLTPAAAKKLKVAVDSRRKSVYDFNVTELKKLEVPEKKKPKAKKAVKKPKPKKVAKKPAAKAKAAKKPAKKPAKKKAAAKPKKK